MKILKEKFESKDSVIFTCKKCGCEFECDKDEYWRDNSITLTSWPSQHYVYANCPKCYKVCQATKTDHTNINYVTSTYSSDSTYTCKEVDVSSVTPVASSVTPV